MKKSLMRGLVISGALAACFSTSVHAVGITVDGGTTGVGAHLVLPLVDHKLNARIGMNTLSYTYDGDTSDVTYQFKLKLQTYDALFDYYPFGGAFRLTMGAVVNTSRVDANVKSKDLELNGHSYQSSEVGNLYGRIDFKKYVPYVGLGWGNATAPNKGWGLTSDIGVIFQGSPQSSVYSSGCHVSEAICSQFETDLQEENRQFQKKSKNLEYYPVIRVGITYKF